MPSEDYASDTTVNGAPEGEPKEEKLRPGVDVSAISRWEAFFQGTEYIQKVREVEDLYPEVRSVNVVYDHLDRFDTDLAASLLDHPDLGLLAGKQALKNLMHQDLRRADLNLRLVDLPRDSRVEIRDLRAKHVGRLVSVEGLVRKATEVRPKITDALFQCLRCGHVIKEAQEGLFFKEPMECYKEQDGCGRSAGSTKFKLLTEESRFVDTQKVEVQESPEGLRGGAQPERLTGYLEDDAAGSVAPGDRVILNGILRSVQKGQPAKSTLFDINLDIVSAESQRHEYEEIQISDDDVKTIIEVAHAPDVFKKIVASISPTIYGYDMEKEALALQLFGGVPKALDDGTRIRGDIHILLVGDPGVAKCVTGDADITMADGSARKIKDVVEGVLSTAEVETIDDGVTAPADLDVLTFSMRGRMEGGKAVRVWKRTAPERMVKVTTEKGRTIVVTPTHPLFVQYGPRIRPVEISCIKVGTPIAASTGLFKQWSDQDYGWDMGFDLDPIVSKEDVPPPEEWVYDLEVEGSHNYIANGLVSHNSQMLRYMSRLAPRGIYASGKSSSAAGLCVAPDSVIEVDGAETTIGDFVESRMRSPVEARPGQWREPVAGQCRVATASDRRRKLRSVDAVWRIETPSFLVELVESSGRRLTLTPETKVWCEPDTSADGWVRASDTAVGQHVLVRADGGDDFQWSTVTEVRKFSGNLPRNVYDLTVKDSHSFVANGFVVHNTAAAVKDDFGEGRWTLEAGALVLADRGHACIEESQPVLTNRGFKAIKDVQPGDRVVNIDGGYHTATVRRLIYNGIKSTIKVHTYSGEVIECTPDHRLLTSRGWVEAGAVTSNDMIKVPADHSMPAVVRTESMERGFLHGFALSDIYYMEPSPKSAMGFSAAAKSDVRARYVLGLLEKHHSIHPHGIHRPPNRTFIRGKEIDWSEGVNYEFSSRSFKKEVADLFHQDLFDLDDRDYCLGFLAGVMSTDCCVSHKKGTYGEKHIIDIGIGRRKYGAGWTIRKQRMLVALFQSFGIMAVRRRRKVQIFSLASYNRAVELIAPLVVGKNKAKLYLVEARTKIGSYDALLDDDYAEWLASVKFHTSRTVEMGLHSRIYLAVKKRRVTATLMDTLRPHWTVITDAPFREPSRDYLLNPVVKVEPGSEKPVYDLTVDGEPNFLVAGGIVHNCIDELDKMTDQDRSSMHEAMESQCYDDQTEVLTESGWKLFRDLDPTDRVASLTRDGGLYYARPSQYVNADYDGDIYRVRSPAVDLAVTPNHNMYVSTDGPDPGRFALHRMDRLPLDRPLRFKNTARWAGTELGEDELAIGARASLHPDGTLTMLRGDPMPRRVMEASAPQLLGLLTSMTSEAEGGVRTVTTTSQQFADDVQEMALKAGVAARIDDEMTANGLIRHVVTVLGETTPVVEASRHITRERYRGRIHCVEVPDHVLYVRRNGRAVWCGNTISVAKAGITATLQCRCSLLGAANPKYGRFQEHQYIAEQINMPPALLSRFDLIFAMTDKPSADKDASITQHILKAHRRGQVRRHEDPSKLVGVDGEKILNDTTAMLPALDRDFFRKYVAYSKMMSPVLSDEAMAIISQFYLKIRKQGEGEGTSVPITARQLEAFVRLSEASARARLSPVVTADDAQRSVRIVEYYLRRIAGEGDRLDFDIIATGTSHSQREQIGMIKKMISALSKSAEFKKGVPADEIYKSALAEGIAEDRAKTLLKRLAQNGEIYQPSPGLYRLASEG